MSQPASRHYDGAVHYPDSDGQPVAETEVHVDELLGLMAVLKNHFRDAADVYVGANMFVYYEQGNPRAVFAPDVFVTRGVPKRVHRTYKLWEEGRPPSFVMEISSSSTWLEDTGNKKALCARLGVQEYFLFDPLGDYLEPRLQGFSLERADYERIAASSDGSVDSDVLGLRLRAEGDLLRCEDRVTGKRLLRIEEAPQAQREAEQAQREAEHAQREAERAQREAEHAQREAERAQREAERARREAEQAQLEADQRAEAAEKELERLRRELAALRGEPER
jgi:Uma2 family endonuclease